jgi:hypothetical protein
LELHPQHRLVLLDPGGTADPPFRIHPDIERQLSRGNELVMRTVLDGRRVLLLVLLSLLFGIGVEPDDLGLRRECQRIFDVHADFARAGFGYLAASAVKAAFRHTPLCYPVVRAQVHPLSIPQGPRPARLLIVLVAVHNHSREDRYLLILYLFFLLLI